MNRSAWLKPYIWIVVLLAGVLVIYVPGLHNALIFDDARLSDTIFSRYGALWPFKPRFLAYGSFVWLEPWFGQDWWKHRLINVALHFGVALALWGFFRRLLAHVAWPEDLVQAEGFGASRDAALAFGVLFFAFNPVAVYAVAYLIQRSILAATLAVVLACYFFVRALTEHRQWLIILALFCYLLALACKEHAVMAVSLAFPLYVFLRRPPFRQVLMLGCGVLLVLGASALLLVFSRGSIIGKVFDETSLVFIQQLKQISPSVADQAYGLSILNQAALFFRYGLLWFLPNVQWMSIDMRPGFPVSPSWGYWLALVTYVGVLFGALWLVVFRSGALAFLGLCLAVPALLFCSEFSTVWIQDPFVLYRSYLWAITIPGLIVLALVGIRSSWILRGGVVVLGALLCLSIERVMSLKDSPSVWSDAIAKTDLNASANAVGRWRAFNNRGAYYLENDRPELALQDFEQADVLGDVQGLARFNAGVALYELKRPKEALASFNAAESKGFTESALYFQRGEALFALAEYEAALRDYSMALKQYGPSGSRVINFTKQRKADAALQARKYEVAAQIYLDLIASHPRNYALRLGLAMAYIGKKDLDKAQPILEELLSEHPHPGAYYGLAVVQFERGRKQEALANIDLAIRIDPRHPGYQMLRAQISGVSK